MNWKDFAILKALLGNGGGGGGGGSKYPDKFTVISESRELTAHDQGIVLVVGATVTLPSVAADGVTYKFVGSPGDVIINTNGATINGLGSGAALRLGDSYTEIYAANTPGLVWDVRSRATINAYTDDKTYKKGDIATSGGLHYLSLADENTDNALTDATKWLCLNALDSINSLTSKSTPVGDDVIAIGDSAASFAGKKVTINELLAPLRNIARVEKTTHTQYSSTMPVDNTIPQNTEGSEIFNVSHTPTNANNYIRVKAVIGYCHDSPTASFITAALFKDSGANAVAVQTRFVNIGTNNDGQIVIDYRVLAGSTSAATWRLRMGSSSGQTFTVSGRINAALFGGAYISSMTVSEEVA